MKPKEQLIRTVSSVGNGAHIFTPREWIGESVLITRLGLKNPKERILEELTPFLDKIVAVILYGSHARKESGKSSDLDVLVVSYEKFKLEKKEGLDITVLAVEEIPQAIKQNPILMYSIFKEGKPIINPQLLENLKEIKIKESCFLPFLKQTEKSLKENEEILELDKRTGKFASDSLIYSLILRLRGVFIINHLISRNNFSNKEFKNWIEEKGIDYKKTYETYCNVRSGYFGKDSQITIREAEDLLKILKNGIESLKKKIK